MIYRDFKGIKLSRLGYGLMRMPVIDGDNKQIDKEKSAELIDYAMKHGINYYDTAYGYHGGTSETVVAGEILQKYPRDSFYLSSKFPGYDVENIKNAKAVFQEQLDKCKVDYFDFYLFHTVSDSNIEDYLNPEYKLWETIYAEKKSGRIKHLGFSSHASLENLKRFLEVYGEYVEFGQIQLNWLDWTYQKAKEQYEILQAHNLPVWVMEPLRGGKLATLDEGEVVQLQAARPHEKTAAWAFRFLQTLPGVQLVLSGMTTMEALQENLETFSEEKPLNEAEMKTLMAVADDKLSKLVVPCTACQYCVPECPRKLNIPFLMEAYNMLAFSEGGSVPSFMKDLEDYQMPSACIACKRCEKQCPQGIKIAETMAKLSAKIKPAQA
ncbi:MAG: aldo/keto reductase [Eubacteriales bacterium]|nr:aldo/keto reductase [Eubacteriales bacterium]